MSFGQALQKKLDEAGQTQGAAAKTANVSGSLISKISRGTRKPPKDVMRTLTIHYDDPELAVAAANEATGGAWVPWLNNADLHPSSVAWKTREEVLEAYEATGAAPLSKRRDQLTESDMVKIKEAIREAVEAITALVHMVATMCKAYKISWTHVWKMHRMKLKESKYLK
ncbi:helix-turn-helix transcriptional regulator [Cohnella xylanilytica]|uniref:Helix-turn-helix transcriptional regulator n=1 Tax=Cohnella xylanilytica TaxID=557555 RepID=A0A841TNV8_9BACL|nr:helix-turn-helix transcriptional regulator [Cohnella xylanilytica]MBB6689947.1 helix-turn-helix transcriptional regulator [Cohnella xylanilytica]